MDDHQKQRNEFLKEFIEKKKVELKLNGKIIILENFDKKEEAIILTQIENNVAFEGKHINKFLLQHFTPATWFASEINNTICSLYESTFVDCESIVNEIRTALADFPKATTQVTTQTTINDSEELPELVDDVETDKITETNLTEIYINFSKDQLDGCSDESFISFLFDMIRNILELGQPQAVDRFDYLIKDYDFTVKTLADHVSKAITLKPDTEEIKQSIITLVSILREKDLKAYENLFQTEFKDSFFGVAAKTADEIIVMINSIVKEKMAIVDNKQEIDENAGDYELEEKKRNEAIEKHLQEMELKERKEKRRLLTMLREGGFTKYNIETPLEELKRVVDKELRTVASNKSNFLQNLNDALKNRKID